MTTRRYAIHPAAHRSLPFSLQTTSAPVVGKLNGPCLDLDLVDRAHSCALDICLCMSWRGRNRSHVDAILKSRTCSARRPVVLGPAAISGGPGPELGKRSRIFTIREKFPQKSAFSYCIGKRVKTLKPIERARTKVYSNSKRTISQVYTDHQQRCVGI